MSFPLAALLLLSMSVPPSANADPQQLWPTALFTDQRGPHTDLAATLQRVLLALMEVDAGVQKSNKESHGWHSSELLDSHVHRMLTPASAAEASAGAILAVHDLVVSAAHQMVAEMDAVQFGPLARGTTQPSANASVHVQNMWANVNGHGDFNILHTHPNSVLSGVLYVDAGSPATPNASASAEFVDPRPLVSCPRAGARSELFMLCAWCPDHLCAAGAGLQPRTSLHGSGVEHRLAPRQGALHLWPSWLPHRVAPHTGSAPRISVRSSHGHHRLKSVVALIGMFPMQRPF
jgi:hypothetical protein